jgi:hypothetical protein
MDDEEGFTTAHAKELLRVRSRGYQGLPMF